MLFLRVPNHLNSSRTISKLVIFGSRVTIIFSFASHYFFILIQPLFRRAQAYENLDQLENALEGMEKIFFAYFLVQCNCYIYLIIIIDYKQINIVDPSNIEAQRKTRELQTIIQERTEKLKEEAIG